MKPNQESGNASYMSHLHDDFPVVFLTAISVDSLLPYAQPTPLSIKCDYNDF